jgi:hypothetical protein
VFIVHGDIMSLAADAWLLPGGPGLSPGTTWLRRVGPGPASGEDPRDFGQRGRRVVRWRPRIDGWPEPWLADLGGSRETPIEWYVDGAREYLERASTHLAGTPTRHGRARHLLALPLVGTGQGGKRHRAGAVARELLPALYEFAESTEHDVALVMIEGAAYSAAQSVRREHHAERAWRALGAERAHVADQLAGLAASRDLVIFTGAGVGVGAGLPLWSGLLEELAREAAKMRDDELEQLRQLGAIDRAHVIERRLGGEGPLREAVTKLLVDRSSHYALTHALLAALPVDEVVTTNYDTLFETASAAASRPVTVLPYQRLAPDRRWLLKLHGSVERPDDIVLTRDNFLAYRERRQALAGIVQALLITRHMLFVGFSLEDDNFHQIVHAVRRAVHPSEPADDDRGPFGTALVVAANPLTEELWRGSLRWIPLADGHRESQALAARRLEIFLDRVGAGASSAAGHLFDARWDEVLTDGERELRDRLAQLFAEVSPEAKGTHAFDALEDAMVRLGWKRRR